MGYSENIDVSSGAPAQDYAVRGERSSSREIDVTIKTEEMRAFVAVVRHQSVSRAAEALHLTQSAVTRRVQSFEASLGVELLNRNDKPLRPSQLGLLVYEQCCTVLKHVTQLRGMVVSGGMPQGIFRLGAPQFIGETALTEGLRQLNTLFPVLRVEVTTALSPTLLESVEGGELDAAAIVLPMNSVLPATVGGSRLADFDMMVVGSKGEFNRGSYALKDIYEQGWVLNPRDCGFRSGLEQALTAKGLPLKLNMDVHGSEVQLGLIAGGVGLGLVPRRQITASRYVHQLQQIDLTDFRLRNSIWIVHAKVQGCLGTATAAFADVIKRLFVE
jgi:DNA-binding transcriptional LysR family regulator